MTDMKYIEKFHLYRAKKKSKLKYIIWGCMYARCFGGKNINKQGKCYHKLVDEFPSLKEEVLFRRKH